jgi:hypothetical protein
MGFVVIVLLIALVVVVSIPEGSWPAIAPSQAITAIAGVIVLFVVLVLMAVSDPWF